jgi:hypothetical protein
MLLDPAAFEHDFPRHIAVEKGVAVVLDEETGGGLGAAGERKLDAPLIRQHD